MNLDDSNVSFSMSKKLLVEVGVAFSVRCGNGFFDAFCLLFSHC